MVQAQIHPCHVCFENVDNVHAVLRLVRLVGVEDCDPIADRVGRDCARPYDVATGPDGYSSVSARSASSAWADSLPGWARKINRCCPPECGTSSR